MKQALKRDEVLDFVSKKYPMYAWSLRTLCYYGIMHILVGQTFFTVYLSHFQINLGKTFHFCDKLEMFISKLIENLLVFNTSQ